MDRLERNMNTEPLSKKALVNAFEPVVQHLAGLVVDESGYSGVVVFRNPEGRVLHVVCLDKTWECAFHESLRCTAIPYMIARDLGSGTA